jgi:hypothetical protein
VKLNTAPFLWDRIMTATRPGMTSANPAGSQRTAGNRTMSLNGFKGKLGTRRREPATAGGTEKKKLRRRKDQTISANDKSQAMLKRVHFNFSASSRV